MNKVKYFAIALVTVAVIVVVLFNNRAKIKASQKPPVPQDFYVSVAAADYQQVSEDISFVGTVTANNDVNIISETQGKVTAVYAKVGEYKPAGSVLAQVDDELKRAAFTLAEANYQKAKKDYERFKTLFEQKSATEQQLDQMKIAFVNAESQFIIARRQLNDTKITTPISGVVTARNFDLGTMISPGMNVANVVDIARLKTKVNISEADAVKLKTGDQVRVSSDVFPGIIFTGKVETIAAKGDEAHTFPVEIAIANEGKHPLKAGMFARVRFTSLNRDKVLAIPRAAIVGSMKDAKVFVVTDGTAKLRSVVVGPEFGNNVEILSGINSGEQVVISGQNSITDNTKVNISK